MDFDHVHFYLRSRAQSYHFAQQLGLQVCGTWARPGQETLLWGRDAFSILITYPCNSPREAEPLLMSHFQNHPDGVVDVAFRVTDVGAQLKTIPESAILSPLKTKITASGGWAWGVVRGWGDLRHSLIQRWGDAAGHPEYPGLLPEAQHVPTAPQLLGVDHAVLNVSASEFAQAVAWYQEVLGFVPEQRFAIQTPHSGLISRVMVHPLGAAQLPINAPTSDNSQIQRFLDDYGGSGIQHIALRTGDILSLVEDLHQRGLEFLPIPDTYYHQASQNHPQCFAKLDLDQLRQAQVLIEPQDETAEQLLLQIFSQPVFDRPTFFWELIERRHQAWGFGAGNFQALFEAIEQQQRSE
ncbi:4-hydroxyphenylpyruvate dioxygenase [Synechococcus sp. PCC 6312]|uniref:4-hydroxyphenylpyruvate dioxygenase n=1 Tax=Synechococcus sp. (strain ATCC 27167 / PCC 6312) TaxID=195253 RepID=UPI00029ED812|nr:4-hydroxyphenylpyruvate dioxygenase [Synechococcus sp. PCC 6312]AFY62296.1 4-hydroxyphenylpyruvate dioxygenase [Synechococcus sp. PCC 6312]